MFSQSLIKVAIAALAATQVVSAQPHRLRARGAHPVRRYAEPEPQVVVTQTVHAPMVTVYVDHNGQPVPDQNNPHPVVIETAPAVDVHVPAPTPAPARDNNPPPPPPPDQEPEPVPEPAPEPEVKPAPEPESVPEPAPEPDVKPAQEESQDSNEMDIPEVKQDEAPKSEEKKGDDNAREMGPAPGGNGDKVGIAYSPYHSDGGVGRVCKSEDEIRADVRTLREFSPLRIYAVDCDQVRLIIEAGKEFGTQVMAAVWDMDNTEEELNQLIDQVDGNWDSVHSVMVGNEVVLSGRKSAGEHAAIIKAGRDKLRGAGFQGPVVAADALPIYLDHPELCEANDYLAINAHPYFDTNVPAEKSGEFLINVGKAVHEKCPNKKIIWTETGWPNKGEQKGAAVPSPENQRIAVKSILESVPHDEIVLFSAFDDEWKQDTHETGATEKHWGLVDINIASY